VTMKMRMQFNVMPWTPLGVDEVQRHAQDDIAKKVKTGILGI